MVHHQADRGASGGAATGSHANRCIHSDSKSDAHTISYDDVRTDQGCSTDKCDSPPSQQ